MRKIALIERLKTGIGYVTSRLLAVWGWLVEITITVTKAVVPYAISAKSACIGAIKWLGATSRLLFKRYWIDATAVVGLLILVSVFTWIWQIEHWRPYAITVAGPAAAVLLASAPFVPPRYMWIPILCGGILTGWVTWFTAVDITKKGEELARKDAELSGARNETAKRDYRIEKLQGYLWQFVERVRAIGTDEILTRGGAAANERFQEALSQRLPFSDEAVRDVTDLMNRLDMNNGHALYFSGEIDWHRRKGDRGQTQFYTYLEEERRLGPQFRQNDQNDPSGTSVAACRNPKGYCQQRTAWIHHLLANDFYDQALKEERLGHDAHGIWPTVHLHTCAAKALHNNVGFNQITPTGTLEREIKQRLPNSTCPAK